MITPKGWKDITLKQLSDYNQVSCAFRESIEDLTEDDYSLVIKKEAEFNLDTCLLFSGLSIDELKDLPPAVISEYINSLSFLNEDREPRSVGKFVFNDVEYNMPDNLGLKTKYGQYIEAMQSEFYVRHTDPNSLIYLAHQLAHTLDNGKEWNDKDRDKLAEEFEGLPADTALDFSFFLSKKLEDYSLAYLTHQAKALERSQPFTRRILNGLVGLKRYMSWRSVEYLITLIKLRLIVFYILAHQRYSNIFRIFRPNLITKTK